MICFQFFAKRKDRVIASVKNMASVHFIVSVMCDVASSIKGYIFCSDNKYLASKDGVVIKCKDQ